jgi:hypothetical protein
MKRMKSPFPGMDPFLEGYLWPDVHKSLACVISELLAPQFASKYVARQKLYTVNDASPDSEIGIMYPDVEILHRKVQEPTIAYGELTTTSITEPTIVIAANQSIKWTIPVVEIRDVAKNRLITAIEILSPVNKRSPGLEAYREKRMDLHRSGVHVLEIDLLRRGTRALVHPRMPKSDYQALLMRVGTQNTEVWAFDLPEAMPVLPVPLDAPDADVKLDLRLALDLIYERSLYHLSIDYQKDPPPPVLSNEHKLWMETLLKNA